MLGEIPGLIRFFTDPRVWKETLRLKNVFSTKYGDHLNTNDGGMPTAILPVIQKIAGNQKIVPYDGSYMVNSYIPPFLSSAFETLLLRNLQAIPHPQTGDLVVPPISTHIAITNGCPLKCWHCSKAKRPGQRDLPTESWLKVLKELQDWGVSLIAFTGGEPLIHPDLDLMIASLDRKPTSYIFTSGYKLDFQRAKKLRQAGLFGVIVSLDHYEESEHDRMRGMKGAYNFATQAMVEARNAGLYSVMQMVITRPLLQNGGLENLFDLGRKLKVHEIRILPPIPTGELLYAGNDVLLTDEEKQRIIEIDEKMNRRWGYPKITSSLRAESAKMFGCGAGIQHSYIDASGNVYPCDFVPLNFGNINDKSFREIWCDVAKAMGKPRARCFMNQNVQLVQQLSNGNLPLSPQQSQIVCNNCIQDDAMPFYESWGGLFQ